MAAPWILFGAFDRHNLGDLLMPHLLAALLPGRELVFAGLAARDLRPEGGHAVRALADVAAALPRPGAVLHVGGEILTTTAWQAAAMLQPPAGAAATLGYLDGRPAEREVWSRRLLGTDAAAPYAAGARFFVERPPTAYLAAGGVALARADAMLRAEVAASLRAARVATVRDLHTQAALRADGVATGLLPDVAVLTAALLGERIAARRGMLRGCVAVQCSAEFADDASLAALAAQAAVLARDHGAELALFRAGAAPWHDDLATLHRLAGHLARGGMLGGAPPRVQVVETLHVLDLCALVAQARAVLASSLHAGIVARAFGVPCTPLRSPAAAAGPDKLDAWQATWGACPQHEREARCRAGVAELVTALEG